MAMDTGQRVGLYCRSFMRKLDEWEIQQKLRRIPRQSRRRALLILAGVVFVLYCLYPSSSRTGSYQSSSCLQDRLSHYEQRSNDAAVGLHEWSVKFAGNGFIGVGFENDLRFGENGSRVLSLSSGFHPLVRVSIPDALSSNSAHITNFDKGQWKSITCYNLGGECACVEEKVFAHATLKSILVQELKIVNPSSKALRVEMSRPQAAHWNSEQLGATDTPSSTSTSAIWSREIVNNDETNYLSAICSSAPSTLTVAQKREESLSFVCAVGARTGAKDVNTIRGEARSDAVVAFQKARVEGSSALENKHNTAWEELNQLAFYLSPSKAPDVLHGVQINATRYMLMSNVQAFDLQEDGDALMKKEVTRHLTHVGKCYAGHSALLYPSRLWQKWDSTADIVRLAAYRDYMQNPKHLDLWLLTLEQKGCAEFLKAGARGVARAYVMSLLAASFDQSHMEIGIDPADLHRQMRSRAVPMAGASKATVDVNLHLDDENVPYMLVSSTDQLFACDAGCQDDPVTLGKRPTRIPVKVTKPLTSILYVAMSRKHLTQLRSTIHVSEVNHAPAHENEVIAMHEHGHRLGGLPTFVWVILGLFLIAFHVFLVKLLWTEWKKGDTTPYNPYLRSRYSYARSH